MRLLQQGFSLIETLVAFTILALSLGVILQIFSHGTHHLSLGQTTTEAVILAHSLIATAPYELQEGTILEGRERQMTWQITAERYQTGKDNMSDNGALKLQRLQVNIHWQERGRTREYSITTLSPDYDNENLR